MSKEQPAARFWDKIAPKYARKPVPDETIYQRKLQLTQKYLEPDDLVLEFGCGTGSTALIHAPRVKRINASDISPAMIEIAKQRAEQDKVSNVSFDVGELESFKIEPQSYDAVLGLNIMHLLHNPGVTLDEVHKVLKTGGVFVSSTALLKHEPAFVRWIVNIMQAVGRAPHINFLTKDEYLKLVTDAGFEIVEQWMPDKSSVFLIACKPV